MHKASPSSAGLMIMNNQLGRKALSLFELRLSTNPVAAPS